MSDNLLLLEKLRELESDADFDFNLPQVKSSSGVSYYAEVGSSSEHDREFFAGEIESLKAIAVCAPGLAPRVLSSGVGDDGRPYFISEYKHLSRLTTASANRLAVRLATELHAKRNESPSGFGFHVPTFCGATRLKNGWYETWEECYSALIGDLLEGLRKRSANKVLCQKGELVRQTVIPFLLRQLDVEPVLLHGDLWSGNTGTDIASNEPVIYDPSSFFGHNEADLAIARIFGGFTDSFFATYHEHLPKSEPAEQYELRVDLYELFHYLNHALIFGSSGYASSAVKKMDRLLQYCSRSAP